MSYTVFYIDSFRAYWDKVDGNVKTDSLSLLNDSLPSGVNDDEVQCLCDPMHDAEIKNAIFSNGLEKAPGPDGFNSFFYKKT